VLLHQPGQDLVFGLELFLQGGDAALLGLVLPPIPAGAVLKGRRPVPEELLEPVVEQRGMQAAFLAQIRGRHFLEEVAAQQGDLFLGRVMLPGLVHGVFSPLS
jgi:hypothetical protein